MVNKEKAAFLAALFVSCFIAGRLTAPKSTQQIAAKSETKTTERVATVETAQAAIVQTRTVTKYVDRIVTKPSGEKIETKTAIVDTGKKDETKTVTAKTDAKVETQTRIEYRERLVTRDSPLPRFSFGVSVASGLDFKPRYEAEIGVRVAGPLWATIGADVKSRAAVAGLSLVF